jgi:hypothetical protein
MFAQTYKASDFEEFLALPNDMRLDLGDLGRVGQIMLQWILKKQCDGVDWIQLAQVRAERRALSEVM